MRVYKYYPAHWAREAIIKQRLKLTTLDDINDPFEFRAIGTAEKSLRRKLEDWRKAIPGRLGLISFCSNRTNPVIWSHYADSYRGICLGFDVEDSYLCPIRYVPKRFITSEHELLAAFKAGGSKETFSALTTKFNHWKYEAEKRVFYSLDEDCVIHDGALHFVKFGTRFSLREVILGPNYEPIHDAALRRDLQRTISRLKRCAVRTSRPAFRTFEVVIQQEVKRQKTL